MAKQVKRPAPVVEVKPGADPNGGNMLLSRKMGNILGCVCLLMFILFKELWIGTLAFGIGFTAIFVLQVFLEKSKSWYTSWNLYAALVCYALAYMEYAYGLISNLMNVR